MPLVSVIMNCHNCSKYLREALDSVYQQTFKDFEIIFWDNLSTDKSAEIALSYGEPLRYFRGEEYLPLGAARNCALEKARGQYIAFLDCDDVWLPEKLEKQVSLLDSNKELGLVYSDSYVIDGTGNLRESTFWARIRPIKGDVFNKLFFDNFIPFLTVVVRREVLTKVGMFDAKYEIVEDYDLLLRIAEYYFVDFVKQPLAKYRIHAASGSKNQELAFKERFQLIEYWQDKKSGLKEFRGKIKQRKAYEHFSLISYYLKNRGNRRAIGEILNLIKLLPDSLGIVPRLTAGLGRVLTHRYRVKAKSR